MKRKRCSSEQIVGNLKQAEVGVPVGKLVRKVRVSKQIIYWRRKQYGPHQPLRANISETVLVLLINEQGEKEKGRDEREFEIAR